MRKYLDLQMFADEETANEEVKEEETKEEEVEEKVEEPEKKYTDADLDKILNKKFAKFKKDQEEAVRTAKEEAEKLAKMDAEQKQAYEIEKLQKENEELKKASLKVELEKTASNILSTSGITATAEILELVVGKDAEETQDKIDRFVKAVELQIQQAEIKRNTGTTPKATTTNIEPQSEIQKRIAKYSR